MGGLIDEWRTRLGQSKLNRTDRRLKTINPVLSPLVEAGRYVSAEAAHENGNKDTDNFLVRRISDR
jgi:hypothetical protein